MNISKTKAMKNVPTHGPGTSAFYKGSPCKILSIGGGKAKILVDGQVKWVLYTSLDDEMYGTGTGLPINESLKAIEDIDFDDYRESIDSILSKYKFQQKEANEIKKYFGRTSYAMFIDEPKLYNAIVKEISKGQSKEKLQSHVTGSNVEIISLNSTYYFKLSAPGLNDGIMFATPIVQRYIPFTAELWKNYSTTYKIVTGLLSGERDLVSISARKEIMSSGAEEIEYSVFGKTVHKILYWAKEKIVKIEFPKEGGIYVAAKKTFAPYLNEAITISKDYRYAFSFDELDMTKKQKLFVKRFLNDKVYQIPYEDEDGNEPKEFVFLAKKIKNLNPVDYMFENGDQYDAYMLPNGTNVILYSTSFGDSCFYINPTTSINESEAQEAYQSFFKSKLKDYGVSSPAELTSNEKSKFFAEIKKEWNEK